MAEKSAYSQAAGTGKYDKTTGLIGKYDNVRRFWEDQVTGIFLRPALNRLVERKAGRLERVRILDLGCGSGDGFDLIMAVTKKDPGHYEHIIASITEDNLKQYVGLDVNPDLLKQAAALYGGNPKMRFEQGDLSNGLPGVIMDDEPFDLYSTTFGTLSHFHDEQNVKLFADIARHAQDGALVIGDWLGRYSYEWQDLWHIPPGREYFMDYRISYIYDEKERQTADIASFPLRLMCRAEIEKIVKQAEAEAEAGATIEPVCYFDRSVLIGRHMETGDYNRNCTPVRRAVNSLFEHYVRTDLESLIVDYAPRQGFPELNAFFENFFSACNALVRYTVELLSGYDRAAHAFRDEPEIHPWYPEPLKKAMLGMRRVIDGIGWARWGDVRANIIEPQLGYSLRQLEMKMQPGTGMGHSLVGVFQIKK